jgi:hypothetical protein
MAGLRTCPDLTSDDSMLVDVVAGAMASVKKSCLFIDVFLKLGVPVMPASLL